MPKFLLISMPQHRTTTPPLPLQPKGYCTAQIPLDAAASFRFVGMASLLHSIALSH